jgi:uncharacterized protein YndB with AHSA1/START domain
MFVLNAEIETTIERPPAEVFAYLSDGERFPEWSSEFEAMQKLSEGPIGEGSEFRFTMRTGRTEFTGTVTWADFEPPHRFSWRGSPVQRKHGRITPRGTFHVEPHGAGSRLRVVFYPQLENIPKFGSGVMAWFVKRVWTKDLKKLKALLEARPAAAGVTASARPNAG